MSKEIEKTYIGLFLLQSMKYPIESSMHLCLDFVRSFYYYYNHHLQFFLILHMTNNKQRGTFFVIMII